MKETDMTTLDGRNCRRLLVSRHFVEQLIRIGTMPASATNVPEDLRVHDVRECRSMPATFELLVSSETWRVDGEGWDSAIWLPEFRTKPLWIVGRYGDESPFQFQGIFAAEAMAIAACRDDSYWIAPAELNVEIPHECLPKWPGAYYPTLETAEEAAARMAELP